MVGRVFAFVFLPLLFPRSHLLGARKRGDGVWLIGENRGECVKDNGYVFYNYCRESHPDKSVYFLIKTKSPYYTESLKRDDHVIRYGSIAHILIFNRAQLCFYTHTYRDVMYRRFYEVFGTGKSLVYLHHGTLGFKKFNSFYQAHNNVMGVFTVGSNLEKDILVDRAGVEAKRVKVTGYARYDTMIDRIDPCRRQIVYMPTHRNYLSGSKASQAFITILNSLIGNRKLVEVLESNGIILKVDLHANMQEHSHLLTAESNAVQIIYFGRETAQDLICESHLLITDYSSVSWDFFYLGKPVVFYRFDVDHYINDRSSYIDLRKELIGEIATDEERLIELVQYYIENEFRMNEKFSSYRQSIVPNIDSSNCHRIFEEASGLPD